MTAAYILLGEEENLILDELTEYVKHDKPLSTFCISAVSANDTLDCEPFNFLHTIINPANERYAVFSH